MPEHPAMHMPTVKKEVNYNTIISVFGFVLVIGGLIWTTAQRDADLSTMAREMTRADQRIVALELSARRVENLEYRVTVQEQGAQALTRAVEELKTALANQGADLRVIREIVTRIDQSNSPN